jgi:pantothenate kinase type III
MTIDFGTALVVCALIASVMLVLHGGNRLVPGLAFVACAIEALIEFRVIQLSSPKLRIDVILPAVLVVTGGICWSRSTTKSAITASTVIALVGLIQLLQALHVLR